MDKAKPFDIPPTVCSMVEHREPYEVRASRTVLGARGGEIPLRDLPVCHEHTEDVRRCGAGPVDEGRPLAAGRQGQAANQLKLRRLRAGW